MDEKEAKARQYREENKSAQLGEIVFTGSSLMEHFPVDQLLQEHGDGTIIYNRGVSGAVTRELLEMLDACVLDLRPRRVFINIGTNDLSDPSITISQVMENYDRILSRIEEAVPGVEIYLMAYYPVNYEAAPAEMKEVLRIRTNEKITAANQEAAKLAERHGQRYIDINRNLKDSQGRLKAEYTLEGMHINEAGYRTIYEDLMPFVKEEPWNPALQASSKEN